VSPPPPAPGQPPQGGKPGDKKPAPPARPAAPGARPPAPAAKPGAPGASGARPAGAPPAGKPAPGKPAPGKPAAGKPAPQRPGPPPPPKKDPNVIAGGKFFEVRKGRARADGEDEDADSAGDDFAVELPRSIGKVEEEEDLKRRFDRESLPDIDERHAAVKVTEVPATMARRAGGKWVLIILALLLIAGVGTTFKTQILDFLKKRGLVSGK
jgi:hypothetical protein